jgi:hypothetical protein
MAGTPTTATFSIPITGELSGASNVLLQWALDAPADYIVPILLSPGFNTISVGFSSLTPFKLVALIPPTDNVQTLTLKGNAGDATGIPISIDTPTVLAGVTSGTFGVELGAGVFVTLLTRWF